jgi:agmatine/peptidylarginine deiminase
MAAAISRHERVLFLVPPDGFDVGTQARAVTRLGGDVRSIDWIPLPTNDLWIRDYGPLVIHEGLDCRLIDFRFNGWGGKYPHAEDDQVTRRLGERGIWGTHAVDSCPEILEGGSIEGDGQGTVLATRRCLVNPNRGARDETQVEALLGHRLGIHRVLWIDSGAIPGDDTDGHVDTLVRLASPRVLIHQGGEGHPDPIVRRDLAALSRELSGWIRPDGQPYDRIELPSPGQVTDPCGRPLPATYANFLILNEALLIPQYGVATDLRAADLLCRAFPGRQPYLIDARPLITQYGSLHCASLQLPAGVIPAHSAHQVTRMKNDPSLLHPAGSAVRQES